MRSALETARQARDCSPLLARPHLFLGIYADGFANSEPARVHFDRALRVCPMDPDIFTWRGREAARRGDPKAIEDWKKAAKLQATKIPGILAVAAPYIGPTQVLDDLLPQDPVVIWAAMEQLHPASKQDGRRTPFLERLAKLDTGSAAWTGRGWAAIARAYQELGPSNAEATFAAWNKAILNDPNAFDLHDSFSKWLEADERWDAAETELIWLNQHADSHDLKDRLDAVRHARHLKAKIEGRE
jgi:hypothetical protein